MVNLEVFLCRRTVQRLQLVIVLAILLQSSSAFSPSGKYNTRAPALFPPTNFHVENVLYPIIHNKPARSKVALLSSDAVDFDSLMEMDIVIFSRSESPEKKELGAIEEYSKLAPLSAWTTEPAYDEYVEFVVDEHDRFDSTLESQNVIIHSMVSEDQIGYGSRQVGGGKGPGNPHGEESETLYYVDGQALADISLSIKPELEILW